MKIIPKEFGRHLQALRKTKGFTQRQLATVVEADERVIQNYELGERLPGANKLVALADALDVSLDELVGRDRHRHEERPSEE